MTSPSPDPPPAGHDVIGVVVVSYRSGALVRDHVGAQGWPDRIRVVVVDNFSTTAERDSLAATCTELGFAFVGLSDNRGFAAGCNAGVERAVELGCSVVVLLNPDADATPEVVRALGDAALAEPRSLVSPTIEDSYGTRVFAGARLSLHDGRIRSRPDAPLRRTEPWLTGACLAMSTELHRTLGGVPEGYFLYWEDVELSHRCLAAGGQLVLRQDLVVRHDEGGTHGPRRGTGKSALYYRWNTRNRLVFAARNLPRRDIARWLVTSPAVGREILLRGGRRQLLHDPRLVWSTLRGTAEGAGIALAALGGRRTGRPVGGRRRVLVAHPGAELYGSDRVLVESVRGLVEVGDEVTVTVPGPGPLVVELERVGARVVVCPAPVVRKALLRPAGALRAVADAMRGLLPAVRLVLGAGRDGVLVNTLTLPSWVVLARLLRRPVVCHVHEAESAAPRLLRHALVLPARWSAGVVVNSDFSRAVLAADAPDAAARARVVRNPVCGPRDPAPARERLDGAVHLLFVGRLAPRKGPQVALATLAELHRRGIPARLTLLGDVFPGYEWFRDQLSAQVHASDLTEQVEWAGFRADIWPTLAAADIVLVPSVADEPFGNTAVEASLAARPVVVSAGGGLPEAVLGRGGARLAAPGDVGAWADAVQETVTDWVQARSAAVQDAAGAGEDFAPRRYRAELVAALYSSWGRAESCG